MTGAFFHHRGVVIRFKHNRVATAQKTYHSFVNFTGIRQKTEFMRAVIHNKTVRLPDISAAVGTFERNHFDIAYGKFFSGVTVNKFIFDFFDFAAVVPCANGFICYFVDVNRYAVIHGKSNHSMPDMVAVAVRNQYSFDYADVDIYRGQRVKYKFSRLAAVNQNSGFFGPHDGGISAAAAGQDTNIERHFLSPRQLGQLLLDRGNYVGDIFTDERHIHHFMQHNKHQRAEYSHAEEKSEAAGEANHKIHPD